MATLNNKAAIFDWEKFRESTRKSTPVDLSESPTQKKKRIDKLESNLQDWKLYYFPKYHKYPSPNFHKQSTDRLIKNFIKNKHWYEVRHWARGLSKSTVLMMDLLFLIMTGKLKNIILTSSTYDAAEKFLNKYMVQLDSNQRLINDYGKQELPGSWSVGDFCTKQGVRMKAMGAGNAPRGNGNEEIRPDCIIVDDFDTDEECRNPDIIEKKWNWFEKALFFTVDTSEPYLIIWNGNIIAEDCCVTRAGAMADYTEIINIRDDNGVSNWIDKNSEEDIDYQISKVSYESSQQEMFNNPMRAGQTFKEITWGACPPIKILPFIISYADPATSNKSKPTGKSKAQNSCKVVALVGYYKSKYFLYKCFDDNMSNSEFIDCLYYMRKYVDGKTPLFNYIENNTLQDPFYQQVLKPSIFNKKEEHGGITLNMTPDEDKKGEKWFRIEANLEPLFRVGDFVFNIEEIDNPHMKRMAAQFISANIRSKLLDGPDACEGAVQQTKNKLQEMQPERMILGKRQSHNKRF